MPQINQSSNFFLLEFQPLNFPFSFYEDTVSCVSFEVNVLIQKYMYSLCLSFAPISKSIFFLEGFLCSLMMDLLNTYQSRNFIMSTTQVRPSNKFLQCMYQYLLTKREVFTQGSYRSWKTWKVLEIYYGIFQDWKVLEKGHWSWKVLEIC